MSSPLRSMFISSDTKHVIFSAIPTRKPSTKHHNTVPAAFHWLRHSSLLLSFPSFFFPPFSPLILSLPALPFVHSPPSSVCTNLHGLELHDLKPMEQQVGCWPNTAEWGRRLASWSAPGQGQAARSGCCKHIDCWGRQCQLQAERVRFWALLTWHFLNDAVDYTASNDWVINVWGRMWPEMFAVSF